jgi:hypothetical protein
MSDSPDTLDRASLYAAAPDEFVAARNALAKALRADGQKAEAAEVAKLRRPTPPAWALNQVARDDAPLVAAALDAGHALRQATDRALAGDRDALRDATRAQRTAMDELVNEALGRLRAIGATANDTAKRRLADTVLAATSDDAVAELLRAGRLHEDHRATSFGFGDAANWTPPPDADGGAEDDAEDGAARRAELEENAAQLARRAAELEAEADTAQAAADTARAAAERARADADDAQRELA